MEDKGENILKVGVQTKGIIAGGRNLQMGFEQIKRAGFDEVDFNLDAFLLNSDVYAGKLNPFFDQDVSEITKIFSEYRKVMDGCGIAPSQMHAPYPVRVQGRADVTNYMQTSVIPKSIVIAETLGVPWMVIHPFKMQYTHSREAERKENIQYFELLIPLLKQCNVKVCVENLYESIGGRIVEGVCADPEDAIWYVDTLNELAGEERFGMCLDTGHLQLVKRDPYEFITKLGSRIKVLHLHENDGIGDLHELPFTFGSKRVDNNLWDRVIKGLREIQFKGTLSFETFPCMNAFPIPVRDEVLAAIHQVGVYLSEQIEGVN